MKTIIVTLVLLLSVVTAIAADPERSKLRSTPLAENGPPPPMAPQANTDLRTARNYPEQPPIIPHKSAKYQVDLRVNQCLECHSRRAVTDSQAPMVSVTHFMNREGQVLASISPRRYFCTQCHVSQNQSKPLVENTFTDVDSLLPQKK
jgi:cytochrome c-type protein NapB